ncbi:MAG: tetratricopeptide repeat protein, partial [Caldilineaceae bacterium]|nr:tetratricopeptide repeat protein [Caldilineaceae bacterium]
AAMAPADLAAMFDDPPALMAALTTILTGTQAATSARMTVTPELVDFIAATAAAEGDPIPFDLPTTVKLETRLHAGTAYVNFSSLADVLPGLRAVGDIWLGVDVIPLLDFLATPTDVDLDVSTLSPDERTQLSRMLGSASAGFGGPLAPMLAASPLAAQIAPFLVVERLEDGAIDGRTTATFLTTVDYAALLQDADVQAAVLDLLVEQEILSPNADAGEIEAALAMVSSVGPPLLQTLGLEWVEQIDPETGYLLQTTLDLDWDLAQFLPLLDPAGAGTPADAPRVRLSQATTYTDHNGPVTIDAPAPALILDTAELIAIAEAEMAREDAQRRTTQLSLPVPESPQQAIVTGALIPLEPDADRLYQEGLDLMDAGDYQSAVTRLTEALALDPENATYYTERARAYYFVDDLDRALADYDFALALEPNAVAYNGRGVTYDKLGDPDAAVDDYLAAIAADPAYAYPHYNLALLHLA